MTWACEFSDGAEQDLRDLPKPIQKRVARVMVQMERDPFAGDVKALQGPEWKGLFRRRIGDYRLLFSADRESGIVYIVRIVRRSGKTYR